MLFRRLRHKPLAARAGQPYVAAVQIRPEQPEDSSAVRQVHLSAFGSGHGPVVADLLDGLRAQPMTGCSLSLVATADHAVVGHVMFTRSLLDAPRRLVEVAVLSPVGVLPQHQRQGVGGALIRHGLAVLAERRVPLVFLEGSPAYYSRLGFEQGEPLGFRRPSLRTPERAFQVFRLPAHQEWMTGTLVYPQVWWDHDAVGLREAD